MIGSILKGTVVASGKTIESWGGLMCEIELDDGKTGYLSHEDIAWFGNEFMNDNEESNINIGKIAQPLIGREIIFKVLSVRHGSILLGRKQLVADPFVSMREENEKVYKGVVIYLGSNYAKVSISGDKIENGELFELFGYLPKSLCSLKYWQSIAIGKMLDLKLCLVDFNERAIIVAPKIWKNKFKKGLTVGGRNKELQLDPNERAVLTLSIKCPHCDVLCYSKTIFELFSECGIDGASCSRWEWECEDGHYVDMKYIWQEGVNYLEMLKRAAPRLASRILERYRKV